MFWSNLHNTATYQDQATLPPSQWDHLVDPYYQTAFPGQLAGSNSVYIGNLSYQAIPQNAPSVPEPYQLRAFESPEVPTNLTSPTGPVSSNTGGPVSYDIQLLLRFDELWANAGRFGTEINLGLREELKRTSPYNRHRKRQRAAEPSLGAGPSHWMAESEDRGDAEPPDTRSTKRRRRTMGRKTEDRVAAQRGETQELRARRTSAGLEDKSKLGNRGLRKERLVAPSQGVHPPVSPRPTTGATLGPTEFRNQAWTWTEGTESISEGIEDAHNEETKEERWARLGVLEEDKWKCRECRTTFFDCSTLRRHCKTVHGSDGWKCPLCDKSYSRKDGMARHMKIKHQGGV